MSGEKPEELQTNATSKAAPLTDAERVELEALRAEKERAELEKLRAEKEQAEHEVLHKQIGVSERASQQEIQRISQQQAQRTSQRDAEQMRRIQEQRNRGRALMEPDEDDEDIKMPVGQKIVIATVVIIAVIFVVSQFIL